MSTVIAAILIVLVLGAVAVLLATTAGRSPAQRRRLRRTYGPEYDRLIAEHGDERAARTALLQRERDHAALQLQTLSAEDRSRYVTAWIDVQARFVEDPADSTHEAEVLISEVLTELGYPAEDAERQLDLAAIDHPEELTQYREARQQSGEGEGADEAAGAEPVMGQPEADEAAVAGEPDGEAVRRVEPAAAGDRTERLRVALLQYRALFDRLIDRPAAVTGYATAPVTPSPIMASVAPMTTAGRTDRS